MDFGFLVFIFRKLKELRRWVDSQTRLKEGLLQICMIPFSSSNTISQLEPWSISSSLTVSMDIGNFISSIKRTSDQV
jgi:hypothetical protein